MNWQKDHHSMDRTTRRHGGYSKKTGVIKSGLCIEQDREVGQKE